LKSTLTLFMRRILKKIVGCPESIECSLKWNLKFY
jgi:hypothetical protein